MKTICVFLFSALLLAGCSGPTVDTPAKKTASASKVDRGEEIIAEYLKRDSAPYRKSRVRFTITSDDGSVKLYELDTWRRKSGDETTTLTQIVRPIEDSDLGSLTIETKGKPTVVTTYSNTLGSFRETDTNKMFFGGLTAGELLGEWDKFEYKLLKEEEREGLKTFLIEGRLKKDASGLVARNEILMREDVYVPVELRLYDSAGRHIRTFNIKEIRTDQKGMYAAATEADNLIYKSKVLIEILNREFPASIDDAFFTREKLKEIAARR